MQTSPVWQSAFLLHSGVSVPLELGAPGQRLSLPILR